MPTHPSYNHNIAYAGHTFHVQSEVAGTRHLSVVTHVFLNGDIIATRRTEMPAGHELVPSMQKQHQDAMRALIGGQHNTVLQARGIHLETAASKS